MRFICELFFAALLIWFGWEKSFHSWTNQWRGIPDPPPTAAAASTQSTAGSANGTTQTAPPPSFVRPRVVTAPTPSGQWMWDPAHRGTLDRPAHDSKDASQDYKEAGARKYWIDGNGVKHYDNSTPPPAP